MAKMQCNNRIGQNLVLKNAFFVMIVIVLLLIVGIFTAINVSSPIVQTTTVYKPTVKTS